MIPERKLSVVYNYTASVCPVFPYLFRINKTGTQSTASPTYLGGCGGIKFWERPFIYPGRTPHSQNAESAHRRGPCTAGDRKLPGCSEAGAKCPPVPRDHQGRGVRALSHHHRGLHGRSGVRARGGQRAAGSAGPPNTFRVAEAVLPRRGQGVRGPRQAAAGFAVPRRLPVRRAPHGIRVLLAKRGGPAQAAELPRCGRVPAEVRLGGGAGAALRRPKRRTRTRGRGRGAAAERPQLHRPDADLRQPRGDVRRVAEGTLLRPEVPGVRRHLGKLRRRRAPAPGPVRGRGRVRWPGGGHCGGIRAGQPP